MTEDEAKTRPCPMSFQAGESGDADNRFAMRCNGFICMAWRWKQVAWAVYMGPGRTDNTPDAFSTTEGYCGLAGKP